MHVLGGNNVLNVNPERYIGRFTSTTSNTTNWNTLTSADFGNVTSASFAALPSDLQFLMLQIINIGPVPFEVMLTDLTGALPATPSGIYVPAGSAEVPTVMVFQLGAVDPSTTPATSGIRYVAYRGVLVPQFVLQATFAGTYGPA